MNRNLLTTEQAANILGVSPTFLTRDRWAGAKIPFVRLGHRNIRYRPEAIDSFIESQTFTSTSQITASQKTAHA